MTRGGREEEKSSRPAAAAAKRKSESHPPTGKRSGKRLEEAAKEEPIGSEVCSQSRSASERLVLLKEALAFIVSSCVIMPRHLQVHAARRAPHTASTPMGGEP